MLRCFMARPDTCYELPGFSKVLQGYMTVAKLSFARRTAIEYMILATKGQPRANFGAWPIPAGAK